MKDQCHKTLKLSTLILIQIKHNMINDILKLLKIVKFPLWQYQKIKKIKTKQGTNLETLKRNKQTQKQLHIS